MKSPKQNRLQIGKWVHALLIAALLGVSATSYAALTILTLSGDVSQTTTPYDGNHTTAQELGYTLDDPFAYDPASPTSPLPVQAPFLNNGYTGPQGTPSVAYTLGGSYSAISFDLYGRSDAVPERDNGLILRLYNGDWLLPVFTSGPFDIPDSAPYYARYTTPALIVADRVKITGPDFFTLMEIRAFAVPEPSTVGLFLLGGLVLRRRFRAARA